MALLTGGDSVVRVPAELAARFKPGDGLFYVDTGSEGELLHVPAEIQTLVRAAVGRAAAAFEGMRGVSDAAVDGFFRDAAARLEDAACWAEVERANQEDVQDAQRRGRSTTRLVATERLRRAMTEGLAGWARFPSGRERVLETVEHAASEQNRWAVDLVSSALGIVAFVFEGRPNVVADATGVLRGGNVVVFRIGRDALRTARTLLERVITPALVANGLPEGAVTLLDSAEHAAGWSLFRDSRVSLAVARGSGRSVEVLGAMARQAGVPVSLHGTGGAWLMASTECDAAELERCVAASLDRKVCNTLNTCCIPRSESARLLPSVLAGLKRAGEARGQAFKLHVRAEDEGALPEELRRSIVTVVRAEGARAEAQVQRLDASELGKEWEWEETPEMSLVLCDDLAEAVGFFNRYSPRFVASLVSSDPEEHAWFFRAVEAPFVGDGYTRWVDGQVALRKPELGLSNWQHGRLLARPGVLTGDSIFTVRLRARRLGG